MWPKIISMVERPRRYLAGHWIDLFGERKMVSQWANDDRCSVELVVVLFRLNAGVDPLVSVTAPKKFRIRSPKKEAKPKARITPVPPKRKRVKKKVQRDLIGRTAKGEARVLSGHWIEVFGERKTVADWAKDRRCAVDLEDLLKRLNQGEAAVDAVTRPVSSLRLVA